MTSPSSSSKGDTRLAFILGVPLAVDCQRQWPQMGEVVRGRDLIGRVESTFPDLKLGVGRRLRLDNDVVVVEWSCDYGDGRVYRNVSIAELHDGFATKVTDYWGEPATTPESRQPITDRLEMPADGIWKDTDHLDEH
jgi:hypothetical protein